jgi:hypothetical protein
MDGSDRCVGPGVSEEDFDFFFTHEVAAEWAPESGELLAGSGTVPPINPLVIG